MSLVTHALMVISYLILAAGVLVLGPSWFGLSEHTASILAVFTFFSAWHVQFLLTSHSEGKRIRAELDSLKGARGHFTSGDTEQSSGVVAELKILQDLLSQLEKRPKLEDAVDNDVDFEAESFDTSTTDGRRLSTSQIMSITQAALIENRVDLYMQPIVYLSSRSAIDRKSVV